MIGKTLYAWVLVNYKLNRFSQWRLRKWHTTKQWYRSNSPSTPTLIKSPTLPSLASRLGHIAFGIIIIGIINSSRRPLRWGDDISTTQPILGASSPNQQKLFVNFLPFEDTVTILTSWNPTVLREHDPSASITQSPPGSWSTYIISCPSIIIQRTLWYRQSKWQLYLRVLTWLLSH